MERSSPGRNAVAQATLGEMLLCNLGACGKSSSGSPQTSKCRLEPGASGMESCRLYIVVKSAPGKERTMGACDCTLLLAQGFHHVHLLPMRKGCVFLPVLEASPCQCLHLTNPLKLRSQKSHGPLLYSSG